MAGSILAGLRCYFVGVNQFSKDTGTKHEKNGCQCHNEEYLHGISGEFFLFYAF